MEVLVNFRRVFAIVGVVILFDVVSVQGQTGNFGRKSERTIMSLLAFSLSVNKLDKVISRETCQRLRTGSLVDGQGSMNNRIYHLRKSELFKILFILCGLMALNVFRVPAFGRD